MAKFDIIPKCVPTVEINLILNYVGGDPARDVYGAQLFSIQATVVRSRLDKAMLSDRDGRRMKSIPK